MEVILYSKECNWYTRCCPLNGGIRYRVSIKRGCTVHVHMLFLMYLLLESDG